MGYPGHALQTQRYMARSESGCLRRPLLSPRGKGYPLHHSSLSGVKLGVGRARECTVFYRGKHRAIPCNLSTSRALCGVPTYNRTESQATETSQPTCKVQPYSIEHHSDTGHGVKGAISTGSQGTVGGAGTRGHTFKAAAGKPSHTRPRHCTHTRIKAPHGPTRAQKARGVRNQGMQSCGDAPCRGRWRAAGTP